MVALFNTTMGPEIVLGSVNTYLDQFEPLPLVAATVVVSTLLFLFFPRLMNLAMALILLVVCSNLIRTYQQDGPTMDDTTTFWYSSVGSIATGAFVYFLIRALF